MKREIHQIDPWSAVRVGFFIGLLGGFLFGLVNGAVIKYFAGVLGDKVMPPELLNIVNLSGGAIVALSIIMSLMSSLIFAVLGFTAALCYNLIAGMFGGLEIQVRGDAPASASEQSSRHLDEEDTEHE